VCVCVCVCVCDWVGRSAGAAEKLSAQQQHLKEQAAKVYPHCCFWFHLDNMLFSGFPYAWEVYGARSFLARWAHRRRRPQNS
jgi:hypothetical protein